MEFVDQKFIHLVSGYLRNFKQKKEGLYNFSCPICGDSEKRKNATRGYLYVRNGRVNFKCHNEGEGMSFSNFLKHVAPHLYEEYLTEKFISKPKKEEKEVIIPPKLDLKPFTLETMLSIRVLPSEHFARRYIEGRLIPDEALDRIFFTEDFAKTIEHFFPGKYPELKPNEPRIVLPFLDENKKVAGFQGRSFDSDKKTRYLTARADDQVKLVFGRELLKLNKRVYILEGPIDSLFIPNSIGMASSDLMAAEGRIGSIPDAVYVFDNEPRNKEILKLMEDCVEQRKSICIWPDTIQEKDINDMILTGMKQSDIMRIIQDRTFQGIRAVIELNNWRKI